MGSIAAEEVAREVIKKVTSGKIPRLGEISLSKGYSVKSAKCSKAVRTKSYQAIIKPFTEKLEIERNRAIDALAGKISKAKYRDLTDAIDKLTKNHQLLTGKATENIDTQLLVRFVDAKDNGHTEGV